MAKKKINKEKIAKTIIVVLLVAAMVLSVVATLVYALK